MPAAFVVLAHCRSPPNGKVDRRALPAPRPAAASGRSATWRRATPAEEVLAGIWAEVLRPRAGGRARTTSSTWAATRCWRPRCIARLRSASASSCRCAASSRRRRWRAGRRGRGGCGGRAAPRAAAALVAGAARRSSCRCRSPSSGCGSSTSSSRAARLQHPARAAAARRRSTSRRWRAASASVVRRHEALRTRFPRADGAARPGDRPGAARAVLPRGRPRSAAAGRSARRPRGTLRRGARRGAPFDLARGPLLRAVLLRLAADEHVLLLTCTTSSPTAGRWACSGRELAALYAAFAGGREPRRCRSCRSSTPTSRSGSAHWLQGEVSRRSSPTGGGSSAGAAAARWSCPPTGRGRAVHELSRGASAVRRLPAALTAALRGAGRREGATLFMTLLAASRRCCPLQRAGRTSWSGTPIAGRTRPELEGLIGFFVNTLVLRTRPVAAIPPSASCCAGCARPPWAPTRTRTSFEKPGRGAARRSAT